MARVTIEDCLDAVQNRFAIAMIAARRARQLAAGAEPLVESTNKHNVHALREIAAGVVRADFSRFDENEIMYGFAGPVHHDDIPVEADALPPAADALPPAADELPPAADELGAISDLPPAAEEALPPAADV